MISSHVHGYMRLIWIFVSMCKGRASQFLNLQNGKPYHSSAVYASAIHSITLPFRMKRVGPSGESLNELGAMDLYEGIRMLVGQARQNTVAILDAAMPAPIITGIYIYTEFCDVFTSVLFFGSV